MKKIKTQQLETKQKGSFKCSVCDKSFSLKHHLTRHIAEVHCTSNSFYTCDLCYRTFQRSSHKEDHIRRHHTKEKPFKCTHDNCSKEFAASIDLIQHKISHNKELRKKFHCEIDNCVKAFTTKANLRNHIFSHTNEKPFSCSYTNCTAKFFNKYTMLSHIKAIHTHPNLRPFSCSLCSKTFKDKSSTVKHENIHRLNQTNQIFHCHLCPCKRNCEKSLNRHIRNQHSGLIHKCVHCDKTFSTSGCLFTHVKRLHGPEAGKKLFTCYFCETEFKSATGLRQHFTFHTKERIHKCEKCAGRFINNNTFQNHLKSAHTENFQRRIYKCTSCPKTFLTRSGLKYHVDVKHKRIRKFVCALCLKKFASAQNLDRHIRSVHTKEKPYKCENCSYSSAFKNGLQYHKLKRH